MDGWMAGWTDDGGGQEILFHWVPVP